MSLQFNFVADRILNDKIKHTLQQIQQDPHGVFLRCRDDILHTWQLYQSTKLDRLNTLLRNLHEQN